MMLFHRVYIAERLGLSSLLTRLMGTGAQWQLAYILC